MSMEKDLSSSVLETGEMFLLKCSASSGFARTQAPNLGSLDA